MNYGDKLKEIRVSNKLTQRELEKKLGVSESVVSSWERNTYPPLQAIEKVCDHFGISLGDFFGCSNIDLPQKYLDIMKAMDQLDEEDNIYLLQLINDSLNYLSKRYSVKTSALKRKNGHL